MNINLQEVQETLRERQQDLEHNAWMTNGLIMDDMLLALGYNKKRDRSIREYFSGPLKFEMQAANEQRMAIKVIGLHDEITESEITEAANTAAEHGNSLLVITDGANITIYKLSPEPINIIGINIENEISDTDMMALSAISKDGFNMEFIESLIKITEIQEEDVKRVFCANVESLSGLLGALTKSKFPDCENIDEQINAFLNGLKDNLEDPNSESDKFKKTQNTYIERIAELTESNEKLKAEVISLKSTIDDLKEQLDKKSGASKERAKEIMDAIDSQGLGERRYLAIVNEQIVQFKTLHEFVGKILQILYELKSFEAESYIFNGSIFRIRSENCKYNDMVINGKAYDIIINNEDEEEAMTKLHTLMARFEDILFECKITGHSQIMHDTGIDDSIFESDDDEIIDYANSEDDASIITKNDKQSENVDEVQSEYNDTNEELSVDSEDINNETDKKMDESVSEDESSSELDFGDEIETEQDILEGFDTPDDTDDNDEGASENKLKLLVAQILNVDQLLFSEEKVDFYNIKYIGSNSVTYLINDDDDISYEQLACKCIDAIMAIQEYEGDNQTVLKLKQKNLSTVNNNIKLYNSEYKNYPRINGTKYTIVGVESIGQIAMILSDICNELGIDTEEKFIYFEATTSSEFILESYGYEEEAVQLKETDMYVPTENENISTAILKGDMFNNIIITKNSLRAQADIINKTQAVKTRYTAVVLSSSDDYNIIVESMIKEALKNNIDINTDSIGYVAGETYKILSEDIMEVNEQNKEIKVGDKIYYCSNIEDWQIPSSLIRIHTSIFNNTSIAIKTLVNADAVNFYGSEYETTEPSTSLAIKSYTDYVASCVR